MPFESGVQNCCRFGGVTIRQRRRRPQSSPAANLDGGRKTRTQRARALPARRERRLAASRAQENRTAVAVAAALGRGEAPDFGRATGYRVTEHCGTDRGTRTNRRRETEHDGLTATAATDNGRRGGISSHTDEGTRGGSYHGNGGRGRENLAAVRR